MTRRQFGTISAGALGSLAFGNACVTTEVRQRDARLSSRPRTDVRTTGSGSSALGLDSSRDGILHLPSKYAGTPLPFLLLLHGAGGSGNGILRRLASFSDEAGIAILSPDSRRSTWDAIGGRFGDDVAFINRALAAAFERVLVDPQRVAVGGFSDGASYAISLGLQNGDLFRRVVAYSPGFFVGGEARGKPAFFISHGTEDEILPIDRCSRIIVAKLQEAGYAVNFRQFDGGHDIPPNIARAGMQWAVQDA